MFVKHCSFQAQRCRTNLQSYISTVLLTTHGVISSFKGKGFSEESMQFLIHVSPPHQLTYPPGIEASREVANLTERKNPHTPVCLLPNLTPIISGKTEWAEKFFRTSMVKRYVSKFYISLYNVHIYKVYNSVSYGQIA